MSKVKDVMKSLERYAPRNLAMDWDNVGLLVGDSMQDVTKLMVCLDATDSSIDEAIKQGADMILCHHPIIFKPLRKVITEDESGRLILKLIKNGISLVAAHTNLDIADDGVNSVLAEKLGLQDPRPLGFETNEKLYKLAVFVPEESLEKVRNAMCEAGAGIIGNYSYCSFKTPGKGSFYPEEGAKPHLGEVGSLEEVDEYRLEVLCEKSCLNQVLNAMRDAHPYEEVAYDIYSLENKGKLFGLGRFGCLRNEMSGHDFLEHVKKSLGAKGLRFVGKIDRQIKKVAVCGGSGADLIKKAVRQKCDALITGDIKYHEALSASNENLLLVDAGHYYTENIIVTPLADYMKKEFSQLEIAEYEGADVFNFYL